MFESPAIKKLAATIALILLELLLFWLDLFTGEAVALQSLFVVPIILSGLFLGNVGIVFFSLVSAIARVEAYRRVLYDGIDFSYFENLIPTIMSYLLVGATVAMGRFYQERYQANYGSSVGRRVADMIRRKKDANTK